MLFRSRGFSRAGEPVWDFSRGMTGSSGSHSHGDLTSLAPHERLPELPIIPREKSHTGSPARENPRDASVIIRMDWLGLLAVQGTLNSLLQHHSSKASILQHSTLFTLQLSHPYMTTGKTLALNRQIFVGQVISLLFNMLSRLVITFLPRSKHLLISWLQSPSAVILEAPQNKV